VSGCGTDDWNSVSSKSRDFSLHHPNHTSSGAHSAFYPMGTKGFMSCMEVYFHSSICFHDMVLRHRDNFIFLPMLTMNIWKMHVLFVPLKLLAMVVKVLAVFSANWRSEFWYRMRAWENILHRAAARRSTFWRQSNFNWSKRALLRRTWPWTLKKILDLS
jgi:hypothetical protein